MNRIEVFQILKEIQSSILPKLFISSFIPDDKFMCAGVKKRYDKSMTFVEGLLNAEIVFLNEKTFIEFKSWFFDREIEFPFEMATREDFNKLLEDTWKF